MDQQFNPNIQSDPPAVQPPKNTWKIVALVIVGILVLGGVVWGGYYWWQNRSGNSVVCTQDAKQCPDGSYVSRTGPNCEFAACPSINPNPTADWQTYRNEKYGFEFRYPKEWDNIVESVDKSYVGFFNEERFAAVYNDYGGLTPGFFAEQREFAAVDVNMYKKGSLVGTENLIVNEGIDLKQFVQNVIRLCKPESLEEIKLGDNLAYRCSATTTSGRDEKIVYSKLNGNILTISTISGYDYKDYDTLLNVFNKILSTFKFINDQTADWQTYKNEQYGFEVKYPKYYKAVDKKASICKAGQTYEGIDSLKPGGQKVYEISFCFLKEPLSYWLAKPEKDNSAPDFSIALFSEDDYYRKDLLNSPIYDLSINSLESSNSNRFEKIENLGWEGYRFYMADEAGWEEDFYVIPIRDKGLILEIGFYMDPETKNRSGRDIISTLKFTK